MKVDTLALPVAARDPEAGSKLVDEAGAIMHDIVESVRRVTDIMSEITAASQEQTQGIDQINEAISQMDQVTQQNAALVEEASAASEAMQDQAAKLAQVVSVFKLDNAAPRLAAPARRPVAVAPRKVTTRAPRRMAAARPSLATSAAAASDWEKF